MSSWMRVCIGKKRQRRASVSVGISIRTKNENPGVHQVRVVGIGERHSLIHAAALKGAPNLHLKVAVG